MKKLLLALLCLVGIASVQKAYAAKKIYALKDGDRMTLYYDENKEDYPNNPLYQWSNTGIGADIIDQNVLREITIVAFHTSMKDARPVSTQRWFQGLINLDEIYYLDYLNTSEVTDMSRMFYNCKSLNTLDVTKFNTDKVKTMSGMFFGCESLWTLDVSKFNTSNVENMGWMFDGCSSLESLDVTKFNTEKVNYMNFMFAQCHSLTELDLTKFNTENVKYMNNMFEGDSSLKTIYCNRDWSASTVLELSSNMFTGCTSLVGGNGTAYDANVIDITYARPDKEGQPGYFTAVKEIYATLSDSIMTLYYDDRKYTHSDILEEWSPAKGTSVLYNNVDKCFSIKQAVLDESMQNARPTTTYSWFYALPKLKEIIHLDYLNTEEVTTMWHMFRASSSLTELDVHRFNTAKVTNMNYMFAYCSKLETIKCNDDWSGVANSDNMFAGCEKLQGGNGTPFDTNHIDAEYARPDKDGQNGYFTEIATQGVEEIQGYKVQSTKVLRDGQLLILVGDKTYDARGIEIKK